MSAAVNAAGVNVGPVLYVLKRFPRLSETFVLREMLGLEAAGVEVKVDALMMPEDGPVHAELAQLRAVVRNLPAHPRLKRKLVAAAHLRVVARHPARWVRLAGHARRDGLWRRFLQAGLVADRIHRDGVRHVHAHFATAAAEVATMAAELAGVGCSVTAHAKDIHHRDNRDKVVGRLSTCRTVVTVSRANVEHLRGVLHQPEVPVRLVHNGVALAPESDPGVGETVLCVARLVPKKGVDVLLQAAALLSSRPDLRIEIIGTGPLAPSLVQLCAELGLNGRVRLLGAATSTEVGLAMRRARVVVLPCRVDADGDRDGMPTVLVEALACGVPIISTDVPGVAELVRHEVTGLLIAPDDPSALAAALARLLDDAGLARELGQAGRRLVAADYTPSGATARLLDVFSSAGAR